MGNHKKLAALGLSALLAVGSCLPALAVEPGIVTATLRPDTKIVIDGEERTFYNVKGREVQPIFYQGTNYLPVRAIGELMGKLVNWDGSSKTVSLGGVRSIPATVGTPDESAVRHDISVELHPDFHIVVDGVERSFVDAQGGAVYPILYEGSNYLPVRAIGELMGKTVRWDGESESVILSAPPLSGEVTDADSFGPTDQGEKPQPKPDVKPGEKPQPKPEVKPSEKPQPKPDTKPEPQPQESFIGEEQAKALALKQVPGATKEHISKCKLEKDDGIYQYEVKIRYKGKQYEIEMDAVSGELLSWELDD